MKSFEERKAEVMRRSGERIRKRKQCISLGGTLGALVVCATLGILLWKPTPPIVPEDVTDEHYLYTGNASEDMNGVYGNRDGADGASDIDTTVLQTVPSVECIVGNRLRFWNGDEAKVRFALLTEAMNTQPTNAESTSEEPADAPEEPTFSATGDAVRITVRITGTRRVWTLEGDQLTENGITVTLSDEMLKALKDAFNLS